MEATQMISDSILESDEEENEEENKDERGRPLAKLCILRNDHIPEADLPLFLGDNVLGRDPNTCTVPLPAPSVSKQHAIICISVYKRKGCQGGMDMEALVWDKGSMNGTRKGHLKLTPNVRYALSERDSLTVADIPCQFVSCEFSSQEDVKTPVSRSSGVKAQLPDALTEKGGDTGTGGEKCVNGGKKTRGSSLDQDAKKTPVRSSCLSFEQTPTHPQGTLVPESDSDSSGDRGDRRRRALVSSCDSHKSSPTCSTFLSPTNKIVPESEDESPITPSSSTKKRPYRHVSFSSEETDRDVERQQLKKEETLAIVDDSEEEEEREKERAALDGKASEESGQHASQKSHVSRTGEEESPASTPAASTDAIPAFNMDSDTDVEGEEDGEASVGPVSLNTNQNTDQPPNTAQFYMDSDTDVDEDDDALDKSVPSSADKTKPPCVISVLQPEGITMDSDTDVDDAAEPTSPQPTANTAPSTQLKDFHLDSDTDVDEEEEKERGPDEPETDEASTKLDIKQIGPECATAAPHSLNLDSDTDDEGVPAPAVSEPSVVSAVTEPSSAAVTGADFDLSDSDTDVEGDSAPVKPVAGSILSHRSGKTSEVHKSDSEADTDVDEPAVPPAGDRPAELEVDSDTDVEDAADFGEAGEGQIPVLCRENTPAVLVPLQQICSTPVQGSEGAVENMDTQAFLSPSSVPFRCAVAQGIGSAALSSCSDSQEEDEDFVVAETQSFIIQARDGKDKPPEDLATEPTQAFGLDSSGDEKADQSSRGGSFQLGLSDSSHLQDPAQALATESTQVFAPAVEPVNLEETKAYAAKSNADRTSLENDSNLEAARCSGMSTKEGQVDLALEATQAYISEPYSDSEDETDEDERKNTAAAETQPFSVPTSSSVAVAETQLMSAFDAGERSDEENPESQNETEEKKDPEEAAEPQKRLMGQDTSVAETQPMHISDDEESDDEALVPGARKRIAKPLQLEDEQAQTLTNSELSLVETQPMATGGHEDSDVDDSIPGPQNSKTEQRLEDEQAQTLTNSELSTVETQPMAAGEDGESDSFPRKRRAKPVPLEETQSLTGSEVFAVETQPMDAGEDGESDEEDLTPGPRKRRAKPVPLEETQSLTGSEVFAVETQPMDAGDNQDVEDEASTPGPRKRKEKQLKIQDEDTQPHTLSEASTAETPLETKTRGKGRRSEAGTSGITTRGTRGTRARLREEEEQEEGAEPPRRQAREKSKALPTSRGRRGKPRPDEEEEEEEEEQPKQARGKKSMRQQKDNKQETLETERSKQAENNQLEKERKERLQAENAERLRLEQERAEKERIEEERKEQEEQKRAERAQKEKEQLERERKEKEEKERLEREKADREEKERIEKERKEQEEKERLEAAKKELEERLDKEKKEQEHQARLEREAREREKEEKEREEKEAKEKQIKEQQENVPRTPARGRRAARRTVAATAELEQDSTVSANDDVPARRTRSRSNSSNSVSSERSASSVNAPGSRGRGRGRGARRTSETQQPATARSSNRRRTVAAGPTEQNSDDISPQGVLSRSSSTNSLNSEVSSCSLSAQSRGRGGRQRGRGAKTEIASLPPGDSQSDHNLAARSTARGRKSRKAEESSHESEKEKADPQLASSTRGRRRANANDLESAAADKDGPTNEEDGCASEESPLAKKSVRGRGQKVDRTETVAAPEAPAGSDGDEAKEKRKGRKRELEANSEEDSSSTPKISKGKEKARTTEAAEEAKSETKDDLPVQAKRRGQAKKNAKDSPTELKVKEEKMEEETTGRRGRGRPSVVQKTRREEQQESGTSVEDSHVEASEPQTPTSGVSRKRPAPVDSSPVAKTPRSSSASPAARGRSQAASQAYKVLFTGVVDEHGERVLARLGGSMARGVADMSCLVTDKVRRTVKFLCAVARGVPVVTPHWLEKSGKAGSFLPPNAFLVKDREQEKRFSFCLQESLGTAGGRPLLQGYEIHVTRSVKPEPPHMKDIISCSGGTFLPKMPSSHKPQTVVISCEEDWSLCAPALSASLPVVTAEFILTGILQQKVDLQTHTLSAPAHTLQPAGGRGRGRKKP